MVFYHAIGERIFGDAVKEINKKKVTIEYSIILYQKKKKKSTV